jgi:glycosyltransferase involved in cell wall biosynthesis
MEKYNSIINRINTKNIQSKYPKIIEAYKKERSVYDKVDKLVCLSDDTYNLMITAYRQNTSRLALIPNGIKCAGTLITKAGKQKLKDKLFIEKDVKVVLYVGRLDWLKGVYSLITSFVKVISSYPTCKLVIVGAAGDFVKTLKMTKNAASKITFTGALSQKELKQWYQVADIGVIPSYAEQCCYVGLEMMMYGLPVVASDGFGVRNMFKNGINGKTAEIGNRKSTREFEKNLTGAMLELLTSDKLCKELRRGARKTYEDSYKPENMGMRYKNIFDIPCKRNINRQPE